MRFGRGRRRCARFGRRLVGFGRLTGLAGRGSVGSRRGLADGEFSEASCKTFSSGGGDVASGCATPAVISHNSVQSSGRSGAADSCTTFSSGVVVLPSARVGDETPAAVSSCAVQSLRHSGPASANTTIRVGWKRRYILIFLSPGANVYFLDRIHTS